MVTITRTQTRDVKRSYPLGKMLSEWEVSSGKWPLFFCFIPCSIHEYVLWKTKAQVKQFPLLLSSGQNPYLQGSWWSNNSKCPFQALVSQNSCTWSPQLFLPVPSLLIHFFMHVFGKRLSFCRKVESSDPFCQGNFYSLKSKVSKKSF